MNFYKFLASDLDGTLLNTKGEISRENLEAIRSLHGMGVSFVPATGRAYNEIPAPLKENPYIEKAISLMEALNPGDRPHL
jgi:HAD superfamily hydrolase (TIGR01484 family)